jgi:lipopolysaccharide biosynthesis glycosyltransferase
MTNLKIYVGYDPRETVAYEVCRHSILSHTPNATIYPLNKSVLETSGWYSRSVDTLGSTEFTFTRFLVPALTFHKGWALYIDCDMLLQTDITELFELADDKYAVMVVKHHYIPTRDTKMDGKAQTTYPRKNWSSVMLLNCEHPANQVLTKELVNDQSKNGAYFHRFSWLEDKDIGSLHYQWNWLVGHYHSANVEPKLIHYTTGGPWFKEYYMCPYANLWKEEYAKMVERPFLLEDTIDK